MISLFNQYSYAIFNILILVVAIIIMRRRNTNIRTMRIVTVMMIIISILIHIALRPGISTVASAQEARDIIGNGRPTLLVFHSNYCAGCVAMNPSIVALADEIRADYNVIRVDIHTETGQTLTQELGFTASPEFVLYSPTGQEIWRSNGLPSKNTLQIALGDS